MVFTKKIKYGNRDELNRITSRVRKAYRLATREYAGAGQSQWSELEKLKASVHDTLVDGTDEEAFRCLANPSTNYITYGFESLYPQYVERVKTDEAVCDAEIAQILSVIVRLAEALGAVRVTNPEAPLGKTKTIKDPIQLINLIENTSDIKIKFPNPFEDELGIDTGRGIASLRSIFSIYQSTRLLGLLNFCHRKNVLEIGAGLGRNAFNCHINGIKDYTIIDLPLANAIQGFFLASTLGENAVSLYGEAISFEKINILPASALQLLGSFGLVLNVDSLTEMDRAFADEYVKFSSKMAEIFLSINHEVNAFTAREVLCASNPPGGVLRFLHSMRPGYVEEIAFYRSTAAFS